MSAADVRNCPMCGEPVARDARECPFCGERFSRPAGKGPRWDRQELRQVAIYQKGILVCILVYIAAMVGQFALPPDLRAFLGLAILGVGLVATIFVILLAIKVYSPVMGVLMGILTLVPCVGLIMLLVINQKATTLLTEHGYKVGLLGASLSQFERARDAE